MTSDLCSPIALADARATDPIVHAEGVRFNSRWQRHRKVIDKCLTTLKGSNQFDPYRVGNIILRIDPWALPTAIKSIPSGDAIRRHSRRFVTRLEGQEMCSCVLAWSCTRGLTIARQPPLADSQVTVHEIVT